MKLFEVVIVTPNRTTKGVFTEVALQKIVLDVNVMLAIKKKQHSCVTIDSKTGQSQTVHIKLLDD